MSEHSVLLLSSALSRGVAPAADCLHIKPKSSIVTAMVIVIAGLLATIHAWQARGLSEPTGGHCVIHCAPSGNHPWVFVNDHRAYATLPAVVALASMCVSHQSPRPLRMGAAPEGRRSAFGVDANLHAPALQADGIQSVTARAIAAELSLQLPRATAPAPFLASCDAGHVCRERHTSGQCGPSQATFARSRHDPSIGWTVASSQYRARRGR